MTQIKFHNWLSKGIPTLNNWVLVGRKVDDEKKTISYSGGQPFEIASIIKSGIKPYEGQDQELLERAVTKALFDYSLQFPLDEKDLAKLIGKKVGLAKGKETRYVLLSGFYLKGNLPFRRIQTPEALITLYPETTFKSKALSKFIKEQDKELKNIKVESQFTSRAKLQVPSDCTLVKVFVTARSPRDAANKAIDAFDQFRGLLNFSVNAFKHSNRSFGGFDMEKNRVLIMRQV